MLHAGSSPCLSMSMDSGLSQAAGNVGQLLRGAEQCSGHCWVEHRPSIQLGKCSTVSTCPQPAWHAVSCSTGDGTPPIKYGGLKVVGSDEVVNPPTCCIWLTTGKKYTSWAPLCDVSTVWHGGPADPRDEESLHHGEEVAVPLSWNCQWWSDYISNRVYWFLKLTMRQAFLDREKFLRLY